MVILGFSSSPVRDGNVDRMVKRLLELAGSEYRFINLHDVKFGPCLGCAHLCAGDNHCKLEDDLLGLYPLIEEAEAIVLGAPDFFNGMFEENAPHNSSKSFATARMCSGDVPQQPPTRRAPARTHLAIPAEKSDGVMSNTVLP